MQQKMTQRRMNWALGDVMTTTRLEVELLGRGAEMQYTWLTGTRPAHGRQHIRGVRSLKVDAPHSELVVVQSLVNRGSTL